MWFGDSALRILKDQLVPEVGELKQGLGTVISRMDLADRRFELLDKRMDQLDKRMDQLDRRMDQFDRRMDQSEKRFDVLEQRIERLEEGQRLIIDALGRMTVVLNEVRSDLRDVKRRLDELENGNGRPAPLPGPIR